MLEELYKSPRGRTLLLRLKVGTKTAFLVLNSSLYHVYWMTYGNQHHHNWTQLSAFPWPDESRIADREAEIRSIADALWERMKDSFTGSSFQMSSLRPVIDDVDVLVGELYDLTDEQIEYTQNHLTDLGEGARAGTGEHDHL